MARICFLPLVNTLVTPNHLTAVRLITGVVACAAFNRNWTIFGGWLWLLSAFLDRADGELARVTGKTSPDGQVFDMFYDVTVTSLFFLGAGIGLRDEIFLDAELGQWPIWLSAAGVFAAGIFAEFIDRA
ncbi:MAG: CDP-alcohol phosphatidyltransferase family protein [Pseudomonadota bacterium]|nr:CDP-alcohol phosphatidyltransferase family protein [Pseudomonadota bacterium]